jgi:hypothetical protein
MGRFVQQDLRTPELIESSNFPLESIPLGKNHELLPIVKQKIMIPLAKMISDGPVAYRSVDRWQLLGI